MIFQSELTNIDSEITALLARVEAAKQRQTQLIELDALTDHTLEGLADVVSKIQGSAPDAIASLKSAVLTLFDSNDDGNDSVNQPTDPTPDLDDEKEHEQKTQTDCGFDIDPTPKPALDPQHCQLTSPLASLLWEDAPLLGQCCTVEVSQTQSEKTSYTEFVEVSDRVGYIKVQSTGEIQCVYAGFSRKDRAEAWGRFLAVTHDIASGFEVRPAKHLACKWEVKFWDMSLSQIQKLAAEDLSKSPLVEVGNSKPPARQAVILKSDRIVVGQKILTKSGQTLQITSTLSSDERFFAKDASDQRQLVKIDDVAEFIDTEETPAQAAGIEPPSDWGKPQALAQAELPIYQRSDGGYEIEQSIRESAGVLESGDIVEIVETRHPAHMGLIGTVESINAFSELPITVRTPRGSKSYMRSDLKFISKGETPQSQGLKSGQLLMGNRIVTTGNYTGLARRSSILNTRMGAASLSAALELMKGGLSPELAMAAATGTADDF